MTYSDGQLCSGGFGGLEKDLSSLYNWVSKLCVMPFSHPNYAFTSKMTKLGIVLTMYYLHLLTKNTKILSTALAPEEPDKSIGRPHVSGLSQSM